jgi:hypothetical protein
LKQTRAAFSSTSRFAFKTRSSVRLNINDLEGSLTPFTIRGNRSTLTAIEFSSLEWLLSRKKSSKRIYEHLNRTSDKRTNIKSILRRRNKSAAGLFAAQTCIRLRQRINPLSDIGGEGGVRSPPFPRTFPRGNSVEFSWNFHSIPRLIGVEWKIIPPMEEQKGVENQPFFQASNSDSQRGVRWRRSTP